MFTSDTPTEETLLWNKYLNCLRKYLISEVEFFVCVPPTFFPTIVKLRLQNIQEEAGIVACHVRQTWIRGDFDARDRRTTCQIFTSTRSRNFRTRCLNPDILTLDFFPNHQSAGQSQKSISGRRVSAHIHHVHKYVRGQHSCIPVSVSLTWPFEVLLTLPRWRVAGIHAGFRSPGWCVTPRSVRSAMDLAQVSGKRWWLQVRIQREHKRSITSQTEASVVTPKSKVLAAPDHTEKRTCAGITEVPAANPSGTKSQLLQCAVHFHLPGCLLLFENLSCLDVVWEAQARQPCPTRQLQVGAPLMSVTCDYQTRVTHSALLLCQYCSLPYLVCGPNCHFVNDHTIGVAAVHLQAEK